RHLTSFLARRRNLCCDPCRPSVVRALQAGRGRPFMFKQMLQWPPTTSSVIGFGVIAGAIDYMIQGNVTIALLVAGLVKFVVPEDASAPDTPPDLPKQPPGLLGKTAVMPIVPGGTVLSLGACSLALNTSPGTSTVPSPVGPGLINTLVDSAFPQLQ